MIVLLDDDDGLMVVVVVMVMMDDDHRLMVMIDLFWRLGVCGGHKAQRCESGNGQDNSSHDLCSHCGKDGERNSSREGNKHNFLNTRSSKPTAQQPALSRTSRPTGPFDCIRPINSAARIDRFRLDHSLWQSHKSWGTVSRVA
jgi:hypothetical protein